ncbi:hypothetical protein L8S00_17170 [Vibrio splendidus]|uniref:hypothetical protein n=1 Tax=Vibrio splendidus TaxID=29497 RepID=UPI00246908C9|nr:hypothetical protein [Vibrio splendidus]MDH5905127.1 hypothetical protein [Vibrio splendidus]
MPLNRTEQNRTEQKAIVEGLIWASLFTLIIRRSVALKSGPKISVFKSAKNVDIWFLPIVKTIAYRAWQEIDHELTWAFEYLSKNALRTKQRKSKQDSNLDGIIIALNS